MKVVYPRCAGIDIHKSSMTVCRIIDAQDGSTPQYSKRKLAVHTEGIRELAAWLAEAGVTEVAMEATGVYWKPVWNALEGKFGLHLCNPHHVRAIPGSKTDQRDGTRIAELLYHGKLPESFIPPAWQRELRDLTRMRTRMTQRVTQTQNRIDKVLQDGQIKLGSVVSDLLGVSGRLMLKAIANGQNDAEQLAELARGRLKSKKGELRQVLEGGIADHHRFQLKLLLGMLERDEEDIEQLNARISSYLDQYLTPDQVERLDEVPGISRTSIGTIVAEIGADVKAWADARKLASWACLCPGNHESGGKQLSGQTRKGNRWLRRGFCQMAWAATAKRGSYFKSQHRRLAARRGAKRAIIAVAHTLITIVYHLLNDPSLRYQELGADYFDRRDTSRTLASLTHRIQKLGFNVAITPIAG